MKDFKKLENTFKIDDPRESGDNASEEFYDSFTTGPKVKENSLVLFNLSATTTSETIYKHFRKYGAITGIEILNVESTKQRGACIYFQNSLPNLRSCLIDSNLIHIISQKSTILTASRTVMLKTHLPTPGMKFSKRKVFEYFSRYGALIDFNPAKVISRDDGYKHAFLKFRDYQSAYSAIAESPYIVDDLLVVVLNAKDL